MSVAGRRNAVTRLAAMAGTSLRIVLAAAAVLVLAGCDVGGDEDQIPSENAGLLLARLKAVEDNVDPERCDPGLALDQAEEFTNLVAALPADVDAELKQSLEEAGAHLVDLADEPDVCVPTGSTGETGVTETSETPEDATIEEQPVESETPTEETTPAPAEDTPPPEDEPVTVPGDNGAGGGDSGSVDTGGVGAGGGG